MTVRLARSGRITHVPRRELRTWVKRIAEEANLRQAQVLGPSRLRNRKATGALKRLCCALYAGGYSARAVARAVGLRDTYVSRVIRASLESGHA